MICRGFKPKERGYITMIDMLGPLHKVLITKVNCVYMWAREKDYDELNNHSNGY